MYPKEIPRQERRVALILADHSKEIEKGRRDREKMRQRRLLTPIKRTSRHGLRESRPPQISPPADLRAFRASVYIWGP